MIGQHWQSLNPYIVVRWRFRIGTSGWNYPTGKGTWNGIFYPLPEDRERGFDELRFYAERFNTVEVNSTFYGQPRANVTLGWVKRTPPDFEFAVKLFQKFTHPGHSPIDPDGRSPQADVDAFKGGIEPLAAAGKLGPLLAQFPSQLPATRRKRVDYLAWLLKTFARLPARRRAAPSLVERRAPDTVDAARRASRRLGADRRAEVPLLDPPGSRCRTSDVLLPAAARPERRAVVGPRASPRIATTISIRREELAADRREGARRRARMVKKAYLYLNNHFAAQAGRQRRDAEEDARRAGHGADAARSWSSAFPISRASSSTLPRARLL